MCFYIMPTIKIFHGRYKFDDDCLDAHSWALELNWSEISKPRWKENDFQF
jgi:hypothetical protein